VNIQYKFYNQLIDPVYGMKESLAIMQEKDFAMALGNYYFDIDMKGMLEEHYQNNHSITALLTKDQKPQGPK